MCACPSSSGRPPVGRGISGRHEFVQHSAHPLPRTYSASPSAGVADPGGLAPWLEQTAVTRRDRCTADRRVPRRGEAPTRDGAWPRLAGRRCRRRPLGAEYLTSQAAARGGHPCGGTVYAIGWSMHTLFPSPRASADVRRPPRMPALGQGGEVKATLEAISTGEQRTSRTGVAILLGSQHIGVTLDAARFLWVYGRAHGRHCSRQTGNDPKSRVIIRWLAEASPVEPHEHRTHKESHDWSSGRHCPPALQRGFPSPS